MIQDGVLCRLCSPGPQQGLTTILPTSVVHDVLQQLHDDSFGDHLGIDKTADPVRERFYWHNYSKDIVEYIKTCDKCLRYRKSNRSERANIQSIPMGRSFEMVAMDILELPVTQRGNKYVLLVSDYFTRWPEAVSLKDQKAETVARALVEEVVSRHGVPAILLSDQGLNFESALIKELCDRLGIARVRTAPGHPQCDGLVERLNRTLISILTKYCSNSPNDWDLWLSSLLVAYRSIKQASAGYSPFELVYRRSP